MKKVHEFGRHLAVLAAALLLFVGCGRGINMELPDDPIRFYTSTFTDPDDPDGTYQAAAYHGRTYIPYRTLENRISGADVGACLGYPVQDGQAMEDVRFFLLTDDPQENYPVSIETEGHMSQPSFYRAIDTAGQTIRTPSYIAPLGYDF